MPQALVKPGGGLVPSPLCIGSTGSMSAARIGCDDTQYVGGLGIQQIAASGIGMLACQASLQ